MEIFYKDISKYNLYSYMAVSEECQNVIVLLENAGVSVLKIRKNKKLTEPIASHTDCNFLKLDDDNYICDCDQYDSVVKFLTMVGKEQGRIGEMNVYKEYIHSPYPNDVKINVRIADKSIICNSKSVSEYVKLFAKRHFCNIIHVNQGYAACSSLKLSDSALITDDDSVYDACISNGFDSLKVSKGRIKLIGYDYGFIGGASGLIAENLVAFNGNINYLKDKDSIVSFLNKHNTDYICLNDNYMTDIGGIVKI